MDPAGGGPGSGAGPDCHRGLGVPGHGLGRTYRAGALSQGASLGKNVFWSDTYSDLRTEYYVEYSPNASVVPTVAYGSKVTDRVTLSGMAQTLESQGKRVVSGLNGDWYVLSTGAPTGLVVTDGIVRATGYYNDTWAIGFNADGTAFIARNGLSVSVSFGGQAVKLGGGINKVRKLTDSAAVGGLTLLTDDFATTTQNTEPGGRCDSVPVDDGTGTYAVKPTIGRQTQYVVEQVLESTGSIPIPEGKAVLTLNAKESEEALARLRALQPGDTVTLTVSSSDQRWSQAVQALGGVSKLVTNGQVDSGLDASRTAWPAIGIKADGTVIFYAMDGKQPGYSVGATQGQVAQRLIELGCVEAICMDGGGSTTIGVTYPDQEGMQVVNKPSDGSQRKNSTAIFLTTGLQPTGELASYYADPFRQHPALRGHGAALRYRAGHQLLPHQRRRRELVGVQRRRHCGRERPLYRRGGERLCPGHRHRRLRLRHRLHHHRPHPGRDHPDQ